MAEMAELTALFTELGPLLGEAAVNEYSEERTWQIVLDENLQIIVEYNEDLGHLVLSALVGTPPSDRRADINEFLLMTNGLWQETGGLRFALDGREGAVVQMLDLHATGLEPGELCAAVLGFAQRLVGWRRLVETGGPGADEAGDELATDEAPPGMIRV